MVGRAALAVWATVDGARVDTAAAGTGVVAPTVVMVAIGSATGGRVDMIDCRIDVDFLPVSSFSFIKSYLNKEQNNGFERMATSNQSNKKR
mmetsp:Transcript_8798/g.19004  ORF Transcript_8798/g.19004 Transcript_8798/m.19004 type:complete len:91 (-) Transcript_8798:19-291(-)